MATRVGRLRVLLFLGVAACSPDLGPCDEAAAIRVAYNVDTLAPAYEGQALMIASCGYARFCHGADLSPEAARGVPLGLAFDVGLAGADGTVDEHEVQRLRRSRFRIVQEAASILQTIDLGTMPPRGNEDIAGGAPVYARPLEGQLVPLGLVGSAPEREVLRNWLACGAPVVERPLPRDDGVLAVVVPPFPTDPVEPQWNQIFSRILNTSRCSGEACHGGNPDAGFQLSTPEATHAALLANASGEDCSGDGPLVVPSDPDASLLVRKLENSPPCGDSMPRGDILLSVPERMVIREWIAAGAMLD